MIKQVMKQALDALESVAGKGKKCDAAIIALRSALDAPEPYDQQALELCPECGWKAVIPGEPCLMCTKDNGPVKDCLTDAQIDAVTFKQ